LNRIVAMWANSWFFRRLADGGERPWVCQRGKALLVRVHKSKPPESSPESASLRKNHNIALPHFDTGGEVKSRAHSELEYVGFQA
jgi:hypothetical protein